MAVPPVVLTRSAADNAPLAEALRARGVAVRELPCSAVRILPHAVPPGPWDAVVFSSRQAVRAWSGPFPRVAAVGPATARALAAAGHPPELVADPPRGDVLARLLAAELPPGARILWPCASETAGTLGPPLEAAGFQLTRVEVYRNEAPALPALAPFRAAAVFCAAPSAGRRLLAAYPFLRAAPFFCIGATTAQALRGLGAASVTPLGADRGRWVQALAEASAAAG